MVGQEGQGGTVGVQATWWLDKRVGGTVGYKRLGGWTRGTGGHSRGTSDLVVGQEGRGHSGVQATWWLDKRVGGTVGYKRLGGWTRGTRGHSGVQATWWLDKRVGGTVGYPCLGGGTGRVGTEGV